MFEIDEQGSRVWDRQVILGSRHADVLRDELGLTDDELLGVYIQEVDVDAVAKLGADAILTRLNPLNWPVVYTLTKEQAAKVDSNPELYERICVFARYRWYEENCRNAEKDQFLTVIARYLDEYDNRGKIMDAGRRDGALQQRVGQTQKARITRMYGGRNPQKHDMFKEYFVKRSSYKSKYAAAKLLSEQFKFPEKKVYEWLGRSYLSQWYDERPDWRGEVADYLDLYPSL